MPLDEITLRCMGRLEAAERRRELHAQRRTALEKWRDRCALASIHDPERKADLDAAKDALATHRAELERLDAEIVDLRERVATAKAGEREREAARLRACDEGFRKDMAHLDAIAARGVPKPQGKPYSPKDGPAPWLRSPTPRPPAMPDGGGEAVS